MGRILHIIDESIQSIILIVFLFMGLRIYTVDANIQFYRKIIEMSQNIEMNNSEYGRDYQVMDSDRPYPPINVNPYNGNGNPYQNPNPNNQFVNNQYPNNQYPQMGYPNNQYPQMGYPNNQYPHNDYPPQGEIYTGMPVQAKQPVKGKPQGKGKARSHPQPQPQPNQTTVIVGAPDPNKEDPLGHLDNSLEGQARKAFIMKVYMVLCLQLLITAGMCFLSYYCRPFLEFQVQHQWLMWVCFGIMIVTEIVIFCCPVGRKHPINMILLLLFTLCESYTISYVCAIVAYQSGSQVVVVAAVMTVAIVVALTLYAIFTPTDFTIQWGIVFVILMAMLMLGIFSIIAWSPFLNNLYCCLGVILFGIYLVIDTQLVVGGKRLKLSMDDYVVGSLLLYIDIVMMFLYLLQLFGRR